MIRMCTALIMSTIQIMWGGEGGLGCGRGMKTWVKSSFKPPIHSSINASLRPWASVKCLQWRIYHERLCSHCVLRARHLICTLSIYLSLCLHLTRDSACPPSNVLKAAAAITNKIVPSCFKIQFISWRRVDGKTCNHQKQTVTGVIFPHTEHQI